MEINKAELENIVASAVQKAMGTGDVQKATDGRESAGETIAVETIEKMVNAAIQKAVNPPEEPMTMEKAQEYIDAAVAKALDPIMKSAGLPSNLNNDGTVQKSEPQAHFMDGIFC